MKHIDGRMNGCAYDITDGVAGSNKVTKKFACFCDKDGCNYSQEMALGSNSKTHVLDLLQAIMFIAVAFLLI